MATKTTSGRVLAVLATGLLLIGLAGCGSSDKSSDGGAGTTVAAGSGDGGGGGGSEAKGDPCQWYTAADMKELLGFEVTMEKQAGGAASKCVYDAPANYSSVEITPGDDVKFSNAKAFAKSPDGVKLAGEFMAVDGVGDEAFGTQKNGATMDAVKGKSSVGILITNGGGGKEAGNIDTDEKAFELAKKIAEKVLG